MSVLIYTESENGKLKKNAFELASYAKGLATKMNTTVTAVSINVNDNTELASYGVDKVLAVTDEKLTNFNAKAYAAVVAEAAKQENANITIISSSADSKFMAPILAVHLQAGYVPNVVALPESLDPFTVKRTAFTNKAFSLTQIDTEHKLLGISKNSFGIAENSAAGTEEAFTPDLDDSLFSVKTSAVDQASDKVTIADAEIVVSGGRGLKGPENWGLIENLAEVLGAATACSKPVSDLGWRPHSEHVGQTGKPVASNLYIAVGISGAIQHLAGINSSKVKVVINTDPEAPFFKAADYGIVGDAFEVVPQLTEKLKEFKAQNA
jgi:electron transfer flavoprotein alpha subunit